MPSIPVLINWTTGRTEPEHAAVSKGKLDEIVWRSNKPGEGFTIKIQPLASCGGCPQTPFVTGSFSAGPGATVSSGTVKAAEAVGHVYKANITFTGGKVIDPHVIVDA